MYRGSFNLPDDQPEDRPVLPSISRIFDNGVSRAPSSLRLPPLPGNGGGNGGHRQQASRSDTWPQFPLPNPQEYSSRGSTQAQHYPDARMVDSRRDPRISAAETNHAMSALASVRSAPTRQYLDSAHSYPYSRGGESSSRPAEYGASNYNTYDTHSTARYPRNYHSLDNGRDSSTSPVYPRAMYDHRAMDSTSSSRHQCGYCGKRFSRPSGLKIHITTHTGEKPYVCPEEGCHRSFSVRSNMRRHVRIVHQIAHPLEGATDSSEDGDSRDSREEE